MPFSFPCSARSSAVVGATLLAIMLSAKTGFTLQLHWTTGATDLTVSQRIQAVLVVRADSAEVTMPKLVAAPVDRRFAGRSVLRFRSRLGVSRGHSEG